MEIRRQGVREILERLVWENWKCEHPEYHEKVVCIGQAMSSLHSLIMGEKRECCESPIKDPNGEWNRCGGCFSCCYDQTIEKVASLFKEDK